MEDTDARERAGGRDAAGVLDAVVAAMRAHPTDADVQRACAVTLANLANGSDAHRDEVVAAAGALDEKAIVLETLTSFKRAGADGILSYFAPFAAEKLNG